MPQPEYHLPTANLTMRQGPHPGREFMLAMPIVGIGREEINDVVVSQPEISRRHCRLTWDGRHYVLRDLGSRNGTYVNGMRVRTSKMLHEGDFIGVGQSLLLAFSGRRSATETSLEATSAGLARSRSMPGATSRRDFTPTLSFLPPDLPLQPPRDRNRRLLAPAALLSGLVGILSAAVAAGFGVL